LFVSSTCLAANVDAADKLEELPMKSNAEIPKGQTGRTSNDR
jgi:hypothetical protein